MKKFFAMLLSLLCVILGLSACTNGGNSSGNGNGKLYAAERRNGR